MEVGPHSVGFRHDALLYHGEADFLTRTLKFILDGIAAEEPIMVATCADKIDQLRMSLGEGAQAVHFADMAQVGANPARIIPFWHDFVNQYGSGGRRLRGIGEPIWYGRSDAELIECQRHESLINVAFGSDVPMWLLCPYDADQLDSSVIDEALRSHPYLADAHGHRGSTPFRGIAASGAPFDVPLPEPPPEHYEFPFGAGDLAALRGLVAACASGAALAAPRTADFVLAAHEVAGNSVRHGGGRGTIRLWRDGGALVCDIKDEGQINEPLIDRTKPPSDAAASRGLWLANHLCDLVQIRSLPTGTQVRLHVRC